MIAQITDCVFDCSTLLHKALFAWRLHFIPKDSSNIHVWALSAPIGERVANESQFKLFNELLILIDIFTSTQILMACCGKGYDDADGSGIRVGLGLLYAVKKETAWIT